MYTKKITSHKRKQKPFNSVSSKWKIYAYVKISYTDKRFHPYIWRYFTIIKDKQLGIF